MPDMIVEARAAMLASNWLYQFHIGSPTHAAMLFAFATVAVALVQAGKRATQLGNAAEVQFGQQLAMVLVAWWVFQESRGFLPGHFRWNTSLPLHICDITGLVAPIAIWTRNPLSRAMLFFWGIGLSTQAFITPTLYIGPAFLNFWLYTICHTLIVITAIYDLVVRGYRPTWRDWQLSAIVSAVYVLLVLPVNMRLGVNYGYLGKSDFAQPTAVLALGTWPARVPRLVVLVWIGTWVMVPLANLRWKQSAQPLEAEQGLPSYAMQGRRISTPRSKAA